MIKATPVKSAMYGIDAWMLSVGIKHGWSPIWYLFWTSVGSHSEATVKNSGSSWLPTRKLQWNHTSPTKDPRSRLATMQSPLPTFRCCFKTVSEIWRCKSCIGPTPNSRLRKRKSSSDGSWADCSTTPAFGLKFSKSSTERSKTSSRRPFSHETDADAECILFANRFSSRCLRSWTQQATRKPKRSSWWLICKVKCTFGWKDSGPYAISLKAKCFSTKDCRRAGATFSDRDFTRRSSTSQSAYRTQHPGRKHDSANFPLGNCVGMGRCSNPPRHCTSTLRRNVFRRIFSLWYHGISRQRGSSKHQEIHESCSYWCGLWCDPTNIRSLCSTLHSPCNSASNQMKRRSQLLSRSPESRRTKGRHMAHMSGPRLAPVLSSSFYLNLRFDHGDV